MRNALFFLSLTLLLSIRGLLGWPWGLLIALPVFFIAFRYVLMKGPNGLFEFLAMVFIGVVLVRGVMHAPFTPRMLVLSTILLIFIALIYSGQSRPVDIAPTFVLFAVIMLSARTFLHILIPERISWGVILLATTASMVDDWNVQHRPFLEDDPEHCENQ